MASEIRQLDYISLTHDIWTSLATQSFGTITCHYIDESWALNCKVLETSIFDGQHTAENIAESMKVVHAKWKLPPSPILVTDNASNEVKAANLLGWPRMECVCHDLNLVVKAGIGIDSIDRLIGKGRSLVTYFHRSALATEVLLKKQELLLDKEFHGHRLIQDVSTRWNSSLDMLKRLTEQLPAVHAAVMDPLLSKASELKSKLYTFDEQTTVDALINILEPFKTATVILSSESVPTCSKVLPIVHKLNILLEIKPDDSATIAKVKKAMTSNLQKRVCGTEAQSTYHLASLLDPRTKLLNFVSHDIKQTTIDELQGIVLQKFEGQMSNNSHEIKKEPQDDNSTQLPPLPNLPELPNVKEEPSMSSGISSEPPEKRAKTEDFLDDVLWIATEHAPSKSEAIITEIQRYLSEPQIDGQADALEWWAQRAASYPHLTPVAKKFLAIPASSTSSERVFSLAGNLVSKKRCQLKPENVDLLVFLNKNRKK